MKGEIYMNQIFIFGHKNPDTDSVTASISLSYLKNKLGLKTSPRILGDINNETRFALDYFQVPRPKYLNDVKLKIKDLNYQKDFAIQEDTSIYEGFNFMNEAKISTVPVINHEGILQGILSMKNIAKTLINGDFQKISTSYQNILDTIEGKEILRFSETIEGTTLVASYRSTTFMDRVELTNENILIVGDRHSIIEYAIHSKIKLLIITGDGNIKEEHLEIAKQNKVSIIKTEKNSFAVAQKVGLSNYVKSIIHDEGIVSIHEEEEVNDFIDLTQKNKFSHYPVINNENKCLGYLRLADINDKNPKQVILVDHNEYEQSVDGIEEANILEIIDHHKIGSIATNIPINFRNMPVGSSNTIIYQLYKENNIDIPPQIAGLMLSGILSDTLMLKSPTTTKLDKEAIEYLSKIANVNYHEYGVEMFKAASSIKGKTLEEILYTDFKNFAIDNKKIGVGQIFTMNIDDIKAHEDELIDLIERVAKNNDYTIVALFVTDIIQNGSYMFYNKKAAHILDNCFDVDIYEGTYIQDCVSRKKQIIPPIMNVLEKK